MYDSRVITNPLETLPFPEGPVARHATGCMDEVNYMAIGDCRPLL